MQKVFDYELSKIKTKMQEVFASLGFKQIKIKDDDYFVYDNCYCKITYLKQLSAFVIESADSYQDAENGLLEDGDLYFVDIPEKDLLQKFRNDLINYYIPD